MVYLIILIAFLLTPIAIIFSLIYYTYQAYKKLPFPYFLLVIFIFITVPYITFELYERNFKLSVIPDPLYVNSISYSEEKLWGFGPGGNETGIRVYPLSEQVAQKISKQGINFFTNIPSNQNQAGVHYYNWLPTPVKPDRFWKPREDSTEFNIYDYICAYGFCIDIKPTIVEEANAIINTTGSYYAYGSSSLIIVSPEKKLVLYLYR